MIFGDDSLAVERGGERDLESFDQCLQLGSRSAADRAEAEEADDRFALAKLPGDRCGGGHDVGSIRQNRLHVLSNVAVLLARLTFVPYARSPDHAHLWT